MMDTTIKNILNWLEGLDGNSLESTTKEKTIVILLEIEQWFLRKNFIPKIIAGLSPKKEIVIEIVKDENYMVFITISINGCVSYETCIDGFFSNSDVKTELSDVLKKVWR